MREPLATGGERGRRRGSGRIVSAAGREARQRPRGGGGKASAVLSWGRGSGVRLRSAAGRGEVAGIQRRRQDPADRSPAAAASGGARGSRPAEGRPPRTRPLGPQPSPPHGVVSRR